MRLFNSSDVKIQLEVGKHYAREHNNREILTPGVRKQELIERSLTKIFKEQN